MKIAAVMLWTVIGVGPLMAAPRDNADPLAREAAECESRRDWQKALELYSQLLAKHRHALDVREHQQLCQRHILWRLRHRDPAFREQLLAQDAGTALRSYEKLLAQLRSRYVDPEKLTFSFLFGAGIDELTLALEEDDFRRDYLLAIPSANVE